jgi:Cytochrome P460
MKKIVYGLLALSASFFVYAGGNPEHVSFPQGYQTEYTKYDTRNRANGKQVAVLYANKIATDTASGSKIADGAKIVMEVYKTMPGEDGKPKTGADGVFEKGKFAAVAVMEKRSDWDASFDAKERAGDWGFALYKTDGTVKENDLGCAGCHLPMPDNDYMFSHSSLVELAK